MARRRADALFGELWANDDDSRYRAAQNVLDGRYKWLEEGILDPAGDGPMMPALDQEKGNHHGHGHQEAALSHGRRVG